MMIHSYPWYIADWRGSEDVACMSCEARGVYRELLDFCWEIGSLPTDEESLRRMARAERREWARAWPVVSRLFHIGDDNRLHHDKIDAKRESIVSVKDSRSKSASKAAVARWGNASRNASRMADAETGECVTQCERNAILCGTPSPSPSPSPSQSSSTGFEGVGVPPSPPSRLDDLI